MKFTILVLSEAFGSRVSSTPYLLRRTRVVMQVLLVVFFLWMLAFCELRSWKKTLFWAFWFATLTIVSLGNMWILSKWLISQRDYLVFAGSCSADFYFPQLPYSLKHWSVGALVKDWDLGHGKQVLNLVCVTCGKPCRTQMVCTHSYFYSLYPLDTHQSDPLDMKSAIRSMCFSCSCTGKNSRSEVWFFFYTAWDEEQYAEH